VQADFMVREDLGHVRFFVKPHWYSRARCVAFFHMMYVTGVEHEDGEPDESFLKKLKVKL
jgi:hypothetical protein